MKKRIFSLLLVLAMVLSMVPMLASAATATPQITKVSMTLNGILEVNFKVASNGADMSKSSIQITGAVQQTISESTREGDLYVYTAKVPAHKLPEALSVELMYDGASVQSATWTAWDSYLSKLTGSDTLLALTASLRDYGTYAAAYANGEAGTAIDGVTSEELKTAYQPVITVNNGALGTVAALYIDDACDLLVKFNSSAWQEGYQLQIDGEAVPVADNGSGKMVYSKEGLLPQNWSHMYDIQVVSGSDVVFQCQYSVYSYIYQALRKSTEAAPGLNNLLKSMYNYGGAAIAYQPTSKTPIALGAITLRDPFILNDGDAYYLYGTGSNGKLNVWSSTDLNYWIDEGACFTVEAGDAYYDTTNSEIAFWAPEVFAYNGSYYMFATFTQAGTGTYQGTAILKADSPKGPFTKWSDGFVTPAGHSALDGTLYIENGTPYMIYCHEWECSCLNGTGTMDYIQLSNDLKSTVGESKQLFAANQFSWGNFWSKKYSTVTDGCHVYTKDGTNYLQWSTTIDGVYTVAYTTFGAIADGVNGTHTKLYQNDGGHGMIFTDMNGVDKLVLHTPNSGDSHPALFNVSVNNGALSLEGVEAPQIPDVLPVHSGNITYDPLTGVYTMGEGDATAMTADTYTTAELTAVFCPDVWPVQGFVVKNGSNTVTFRFGSEGYDTNHILTAVNGVDVSNHPATSFAFSLVGAYTYEMKMTFDGTNINMFLFENDTVKQVNAFPISLAEILGSNFDASLGISVGIAGMGGCGRQIRGVSVSETVTILPETDRGPLDVHTGTVSYSASSGVYNIPNGSALTSKTYTEAEMTASFLTTGWPIQGFAWKQGDNTVSISFGSCGYDGDKLKVYVNGAEIGSVAASNASLNSNTTYEMKMIYNDGAANIFMKINGAWVQVNTNAIDIAGYMGSSFNASQGVSIGLIGYSDCGDAFGNIVIKDSLVKIPDVLPVKDGASYNDITGVYKIPTGSAMTSDNFTEAELTASFITDGWPIQGFAWKQGSNTVSISFGSCGYDGDKLKVYVNGAEVGTVSAANASLNGGVTGRLEQAMRDDSF